MAAMLSLWWPGLGQIYVGFRLKGLVMLIASAALFERAWHDPSLGAVLACEEPANPLRLGATVLALTGVWLWSMHDLRR